MSMTDAEHDAAIEANDSNITAMLDAETVLLDAVKELKASTDAVLIDIECHFDLAPDQVTAEDVERVTTAAAAVRAATTALDTLLAHYAPAPAAATD